MEVLDFESGQHYGSKRHPTFFFRMYVVDIQSHTYQELKHGLLDVRP